MRTMKCVENIELRKDGVPSNHRRYVISACLEAGRLPKGGASRPVHRLRVVLLPDMVMITMVRFATWMSLSWVVFDVL